LLQRFPSGLLHAIEQSNELKRQSLGSDEWRQVDLSSLKE